MTLHVKAHFSMGGGYCFPITTSELQPSPPSAGQPLRIEARMMVGTLNSLLAD